MHYLSFNQPNQIKLNHKCGSCDQLLPKDLDLVTGHTVNERVTHLFHQRCMEERVARQIREDKNPTCPLCKKVVTHINGTELFLPLEPIPERREKIAAKMMELTTILRYIGTCKHPDRAFNQASKVSHFAEQMVEHALNRKDTTKENRELLNVFKQQLDALNTILLIDSGMDLD